jgi:hypothetical protein
MAQVSFEEVQALAALGPDAYVQRVITLFLTHRATPEQYAAMAEAVLRCSESDAGELVACIDRAVLAASDEPGCPTPRWATEEDPHG